MGCLLTRAVFQDKIIRPFRYLTNNTKYAVDVNEVSTLVNTLKNVLHTILATPHLLLDQEYEPFEYWGLEEYHTYVKEEHVVFTADGSKKSLLYAYFSDIVYRREDPTLLDAAEFAENLYIPAHVRA